jgi:hypothetical protein
VREAGEGGAVNQARKPNPVKIKLDPYGMGTLEIGGRKLENYTCGFQLMYRAHEVPTIILSLISMEGLDIELDALVDVIIRDPQKEAAETETHKPYTFLDQMETK